MPHPVSMLLHSANAGGYRASAVIDISIKFRMLRTAHCQRGGFLLVARARIHIASDGAFLGFTLEPVVRAPVRVYCDIARADTVGQSNHERGQHD
jgi:hypothetical protein